MLRAANTSRCFSSSPHLQESTHTRCLCSAHICLCHSHSPYTMQCAHSCACTTYTFGRQHNVAAVRRDVCAAQHSSDNVLRKTLLHFSVEQLRGVCSHFDTQVRAIKAHRNGFKCSAAFMRLSVRYTRPNLHRIRRRLCVYCQTRFVSPVRAECLFAFA